MVRQPNLAAAQLLDMMEADQAIMAATQAVTAAARQYRSADSDGPRRELGQALDALTGVLQPHLDREETRHDAGGGAAPARSAACA